ncbi:formylglycine-generating enzyme family protein [Engelhardtia mirabilis]|uniref:Formylglycine-generating sulfatase enzyme n=1 Tax=Engelhardtia mirabilis TaxID=2528011 RepID=A0A518BJ66_9BACT|nr:Formylglycine-generating sulfatase enzyme [Planctomycetes bacterium Pla133]QDV01341.1 Formylglycine-generating sulfatase enzyme [Planctomycetes bacterium Pla86]
MAGAAAQAGCAAEEDGSRSLFEVERMAFVAAGSAQLPFEAAAGADYGSSVDLLVDRFEVAREDWAHWTGAPPEPDGLSTGLAYTGAGRETWPAFASFHQAREFAQLRGMRLPTAREWLWIAAGPRALEYPWGVLPQASVANTLELDLRRPVAVGTFEQGRSPNGCYDLAGNVAEWVELDGMTLGQGLMPLFDVETAVMGGSYLSKLRPLFGREPGSTRQRIAGEVLTPGTRGVELGLRCVADAESFLLDTSGEWRDVPDARERLERLGQRWGTPARPLLERIADPSDPRDPLNWLLEGARP